MPDMSQGLLDISIPTVRAANEASQEPSLPASRSSEPPRKVHIQESDGRRTRPGKETPRKLLFTVKPGGIAGYLSSLCDIESYVDITAKTDAYVGFLPSKSLERLREAQPIVLLTLAKRLISLLSPLGECLICITETPSVSHGWAQQ